MHRRLRIIARSHAGWHDELFECAPPAGLQRRLGLIRQGTANTRQRALLVIAITWLPIVALSTIEGGATTLTTAVVCTRYLVAAPLLVLAETVCGRRLTAIARHFAIASFIVDRDNRRFERILASTRALLRLPLIEVIVWAVAYSCAGWFVGPLGGHPLGEWSVAMRWNVLVSLPVLLVLILGWLWRFLVWCRFTFLVSRLDLRLVASHPDRAGGLGFVGTSLRAYAIVVVAIAAIAAGQAARVIIQTRQFPSSYQHFSIALIVTLAASIVLPTVAFAPLLARVHRFGVMDYGELAVDVGRVFESKWLARRSAKVRAAGLHEPDFSATTDLYQVVANVYAMRLVPVAFTDLLILIGAAFLPFLPLIALAVPATVIWEHTRELLL